MIISRWDKSAMVFTVWNAMLTLTMVFLIVFWAYAFLSPTNAENISERIQNAMLQTSETVLGTLLTQFSELRKGAILDWMTFINVAADHVSNNFSLRNFLPLNPTQDFDSASCSK